MATDNQAVTAYLPPELVKSLTEYCTEYGIIHKDGRPKLGTAIVELLKVTLSGSAPSPLLGTVPSTLVTRQELEGAIAALREELGALLDAQRQVDASREAEDRGIGTLNRGA